MVFEFRSVQIFQNSFECAKNKTIFHNFDFFLFLKDVICKIMFIQN